MSDFQPNSTSQNYMQLLGSVGVPIFRESPITDKIYKALLEAQKIISDPVKNRVVKVKRRDGGQYSFSYADLGATLDAIRGPLNSNGILILQPIVTTQIGVKLVTRFVHVESGQWLESDVVVPPNNNPQEWSSFVTYMRRYTISTFISITSDEDDDGNASVGNEMTNSQPKKTVNKSIPRTVDELFIDPPRDPQTNTIILGAYLVALRDSLDSISASEFHSWDEANYKTYSTLPVNTVARIQAKLAEKRADLGVE